MLSKRIRRIVRKYFSYFNVVIFLLFLFLFFVSLEMIGEYFTNSFLVNVTENGGKLVENTTQNYTVTERKVQGLLQFKSNKFWDFVFVKKNADEYLGEILFILFVLFQLFRINAYWYEKKFTPELYKLIDVLGLVSFIVYVFSRLQIWYLEDLVEKLANGRLKLNDDENLYTFSIVMMLVSIALKSFAKQGNKLQTEQDLTI